MSYEGQDFEPHSYKVYCNDVVTLCVPYTYESISFSCRWNLFLLSFGYKIVWSFYQHFRNIMKNLRNLHVVCGFILYLEVLLGNQSTYKFLCIVSPDTDKNLLFRFLNKLSFCWKVSLLLRVSINLIPLWRINNGSRGNAQRGRTHRTHFCFREKHADISDQPRLCMASK